MSNFCSNPCEGCPVSAIEDPEKRVMVAEQIGRVLSVYQHQELHSADEEWRERLIEAANLSWDEESGEHVVDPDLDMALVKPAVMRIAREECPAHRYAWFISATKRGEI